MNELEEFIFLLQRHPELTDQLRQLAEDGASPPVSQGQSPEIEQ